MHAFLMFSLSTFLSLEKCFCFVNQIKKTYTTELNKSAKTNDLSFLCV